MEDIFNGIMILAGIPFISFIVIIFAYSAYSHLSYRFMSPQKKNKLRLKLDKYDKYEEEEPDLFKALEEMKLYRLTTFVFALSYLTLFIVLVLGVSV